MGLTNNLKNDFFGGLTAAITALPLAIAFGVLAFSALGEDAASIGALAGIYGAVFTGIFAAWFGGTPCQVTGPTGPMTTVLAGLVATFVAQGLGTPLILTLTFLCVSLAGLWQILFGVLKLGQLIKYIPYPVVAGFMNGIAVIIFMGQLKPFVGFSNQAAWSDFLDFSSFQLATMAAGVVTIVFCKWGPKLIKSVPGSLQGLVAGTAVYYLIAAFSPQTPLGAVIGNIPSAVPVPEQLKNFFTVVGPSITSYLPLILPSSFALGLLGAIDSLLTSVVADTVTRTRHDSRQELIGQGIGNFVSGCFGGLPGAGATVRTLVNVQAGGRGKASGMIHGLLLLLVVMVAGGIAGKIPMVVLAGILLVTAVNMIDRWSSELVVKVVGTPEERREIILNLLVVLAVTVVTVAVDLMVAVAIGIVLSAFLFVYKMSKSTVYRMTHLMEHSSRRVLPPHLVHLLDKESESTLVAELNGALFFGTTESFMSKLEQNLNPDTKRVIIDFNRVSEVDSSGARLLILVQEQLSDRNIQLAFASIEKQSPTQRFLTDLGVLEQVGHEFVFQDLDQALEWAEDEVLKDCDVFQKQTQARLQLSDLDTFRDVPETELAALDSLFQLRKLGAGELLFSEGDVAEELYIVSSGRLTLRDKKDGSGTRLASFWPGTVAGELEMFSGNPRKAYLSADVESEVYQLRADQYETLKQNHPGPAARFLHNVASQLSERLRHSLATIRFLE